MNYNRVWRLLPYGLINLKNFWEKAAKIVFSEVAIIISMFKFLLMCICYEFIFCAVEHTIILEPLYEVLE